MKENCNHKLNDKYNPKDFEDKLYEKWEENGYGFRKIRGIG